MMTKTNLHRLAAGFGLKDQEDRRDYFERLTGKRSQSEMSASQIKHIASELRREFGSRSQKSSLEGPLEKKMIAVWLKLCDAGVVGEGAPSLKEKLVALDGFINSDKWALKWGEAVTHRRFLEGNPRRANDVIEALKAMAKRNNVKGVY